MQKTLWIAIVLLAAGCGRESGPVTVSPELEAQQKENAKRVNETESAMQQQQKALKKQQPQAR